MDCLVGRDAALDDIPELVAHLLLNRRSEETRRGAQSQSEEGRGRGVPRLGLLFCPVEAELAESERIAPSYMTRVMRLALLAPDIVKAILDGTQGPEVTLARLLEPFPAEWSKQQLPLD